MSVERASGQERLGRAKRIFIANLVLFLGLLVVGWILLAGNSEEDVAHEPELIAQAQKPLSLMLCFWTRIEPA